MPKFVLLVTEKTQPLDLLSSNSAGDRVLLVGFGLKEVTPGFFRLLMGLKVEFKPFVGVGSKPGLLGGFGRLVVKSGDFVGGLTRGLLKLAS